MTSDWVRSAAHHLCHGAACRQRHDAGGADGERRAENGSLLCAPCRNGLERDLRQLPRFYRACGDVLGGTRMPSGLRERTSGGPLPGLPFNTAAAEARTAMLAVLGSWASLVVEGRKVHPPRRCVDEMVDFLLRHITWLCVHPAIGDATAEVAQLIHSARRVTELPDLRRVPVGSCPIRDCGGELTATIRGTAPASEAQIQCSTDPAHQWSSREWAQLRQLTRATEGGAPSTGVAWLSASDISSMSGLPTGRVYQLANKDRWRRQARRGRVYYHEGDALRTLQSHQPRSA